ncbi:FecR family protein [Massilia sp. G4R7]|uniref:FecR family protein n=1 Tax=Massilia phyllostachyos TaxID=2898585 RepID=A0ABS8Q0L9_9BURK|nr:FecR domain-containing protein [Massilia phyllostachyos]MCD2515299.1 FecR family protein [Massilia phyllostachyos]
MSLFALAAQLHAAEAGKVIFAAGAAQVADKAGAEGTPVQEGELLSTGADGFLYVKTIDNGLFILRPNTKAKIVSYHVDAKNPANTRIKLELISGIARSKSGDAVKQARQNFRFNTPVAAIGVRGTDFTVYTDQDSSRVTVLTGGVVVSGFADGCRPEGGGPCEGGASRELFAAQRGQLLQVKRGQTAPQLMQVSGNGPDQVSPPRADEPVAKTGGSATPSLDARKGETIEKLANQIQQQNSNKPDPVVIPPTPPVENKPPVVEVPVVVPVEPPKPEVPQLPERKIEWGRYATIGNSGPTIADTTPDGSDSVRLGGYIVYRTAGREYVAPERGNASFVLQGGEATIRTADNAIATTTTDLKNGLLAVDFGKASYTTSFDVVSGAETFSMKADGYVTPGGRFGNFTTDQYTRPNTNNMEVTGFLSNQNGGAAAYHFKRTLQDNRNLEGVTVWGANK